MLNIRLLCAISVALTMAACGGGGGSSAAAPSPGVTLTVPGAPTIGAATAGNTSAAIAFTAPSVTGGSVITSYAVSCTGGGVTRTGTGSASPITVTALSNATAYACSVTASNSTGTSAASGQVSVTPSAASVLSTNGVLCTYSTNEFNSSASVNAQSISAWTCGTSRSLTSNGIPNHAVGIFPNANNPHTITNQNISATFTLTPAVVSSSGTFAQISAYALNGIKFEPGTGGTCDNATPPNCVAIGGTGAWRQEALAPSGFNFGTDSNNGHVQPGGVYHYHGMPEGLITKLNNKARAMTLVGWSADGFPVYARYGYTDANNAMSPIKELTSSWRIKSVPDTGRPATSLYPMGSFLQDYEYVANLGDLDQCNGRTGVTPEFPNGIYHYLITATFPFVHRCVKGTASDAPRGP